MLLCLVVYLPGMAGIPTVDRDEARFAQASRQMLESGSLDGWAVPMVQDRERLNKPPLIYWLQAAAVWGATAADPSRDAIWMYRIPSVVAAMITVLATWRLGTHLFDPRVGVLASAMLAVSPVMLWEARQARADQVLVLCTTLAMWALWHVHRSGSTRAAIGMWLALAAGIMVKGPITPMVVGLAAASLSLLSGKWRWLSRTRPIIGAAIMAGAVLPWVWAVAREVGFERYAATVLSETLGRSTVAREGHSGPPGYHLVLLPVLFWPGAMLSGVAAVWSVGRLISPGPAYRQLAPRTRIQRLRAGLRSGPVPERFLLCWIIPSWIILELVRTKLPHYTMPLYPAVALLTARAVFASSAGVVPGLGSGIVRFGLNAWLVIGTVIAVLGPLTLWWIGGARSNIPVAALVLGSAGVAGAGLITASRAMAQDRFIRAQWLSIAAMVASSITLLGAVLPTMTKPWITQSIEKHLHQIDPEGSRPIAAVAYHEDSLVFATRGRLTRLDPDEAVPWLDLHPRGIAIVPASSVPPHVRTLAAISGFNYSNGNRMELRIVEPLASSKTTTDAP